MVNVVSLVLMKEDKILLLKREKNRLPIISIKYDETPEECVERWTKENLELGDFKLIECENNFKMNDYKISLIFMDITDSKVNILNDNLIFEESKRINNFNNLEEELLASVIKKCNLVEYKSISIEELGKNYKISNKISYKESFMELEKGRMKNNKALNLIVISLIIGALFSIFVFNYLGISVPIIVIAVVALFINIVGIKNKKSFLGLFFVSSSVILSITYAIFTNEVFRTLNLIVIPISLFSGLILLTYNNIEFKLVTFIIAFFEIIVGQSLENTSKLSFEVKERFGNVDKGKKSRYSSHILKGILISIPVVIVLLMLLSGADEVFRYYISNIWDYINFENIFDFLIRLIIAVVIMFLLYGLHYTLSSTKVKKVNNKSLNKSFNTTTIITILVSIILVYLVFTKIQVSYLYLNKELPEGVTFSDYARKGFFQLVFLVVVNLIMIMSIKIKTIVNSSISSRVLNIIYSIITVLTINMGVAAIYKMNLYIGEFGYTRLRVLVQVFTVFLCVSLLFLLLFIWKEKNLFKPIAITAMVIYLALNYCNIDNFIAKENIKLINQIEEVDIWYLSNLSLDAKNAINEGKEKGIVDITNYRRWIKQQIETEHWYEYNYMNKNAR